jgi:hypothetical protein
MNVDLDFSRLEILECIYGHPEIFLRNPLGMLHIGCLNFLAIRCRVREGWMEYMYLIKSHAPTGEAYFLACIYLPRRI